MSEFKDAPDKTVKIPRTSIETEPVFEDEGEGEDRPGFGAAASAAADAVRGAAADAAARASSSEDLREAVGFVKGLGAAAWAYARRHPFTVTYGFVGLVLAVLILLIGLWDTIVIAVFVGVGAMVGQIRDGDNGIVNFFSRLFSSRR